MSTRRAVVLQREGGVAEEADVHQVLLLSSVGFAELAGELEPDRDADEHAQAGLLGDERAHRAQALVGVRRRRRPGDLRLVRAAEPAALGQRLVEDALQPGRGVGRRSPARGRSAPGSPSAATAASTSSAVYRRSGIGPAAIGQAMRRAGQQQAGQQARRAAREARDRARVGRRPAA